MTNRRSGISLVEILIVVLVTTAVGGLILILFTQTTKQMTLNILKTQALREVLLVDDLLFKELSMIWPDMNYVKLVPSTGELGVGIRYKLYVPMISQEKEVTKQIYFNNGRLKVWEKLYEPSDFSPTSLNNLEPSGIKILFSSSERNDISITFGAITGPFISYTVSSTRSNVQRSGNVSLLGAKLR